MTSSAYEQFLKWKDSGLGRKFNDAILAQEREQQIRKYQEQFKNREASKSKKRDEKSKWRKEGTDDKDPDIDEAHKELAQVDDWNCPITNQEERLAANNDT